MVRLFTSTLLCCLYFGNICADTIAWSGTILADGSPTPAIKLNIGSTYRIKVSGTVNLGKWWIQGQSLGSDPCYEFSTNVLPPTRHETFKNSMHLSICDGTYHPDHIYESTPFVAVQDRLHFWIYDSTYEDNTGSFDAQVIEITP